MPATTPSHRKIPDAALRELLTAEELRRHLLDLIEHPVDPVVLAQTLAEVATAYRDAANAIAPARRPARVAA